MKQTLHFFIVSKGSQKFYYHSFIMKLKRSPEIFLPGNKIKEIFNNNQNWLLFKSIEAVVQRRSVKKVFLAISQNSEENTRARVYC